MKRTMFILFAAAAMASQASAADRVARSVGAHPVVYDDYPESDVVIDVGPDIVLTVTGEARTRFEWVENGSDFSSDDDDSISYAAARYNLGFRVDLPRDVAAVIELQGASDWGNGDDITSRIDETLGQTPPFSSSSGPRNGQSSADAIYLYQGYIETAHIGDSILSMRFGRQELAFGTEWMMGNQDFYDGLSYDAVRGIFEFTDKHRLDVFWAKVAEFDKIDQEGDVDLYGTYFSAQTLGKSSIGMDAYLMGAQVQPGFDSTAMTPYWVGVRFFRERETGFHFSAEATYQFGDMGDSDDDVSIGAWGLEAFLGYTWKSPTHPTIKGGVTWMSGDDDLGDSDFETFFTPAGEIHPRLGMFDLFSNNIIGAGVTGGLGLQAFTVGYSGSKDNHSWGVDLWHFQTDEDITIGADDDDELGQEVDVWYNYQYSEHMVAQFAVSYFNAGEIIEDGNDLGGVSTDDAWRVYANLLVRF